VKAAPLKTSTCAKRVLLPFKQDGFATYPADEGTYFHCREAVMTPIRACQPLGQVVPDIAVMLWLGQVIPNH
jgi:hypothetical protein